MHSYIRLMLIASVLLGCYCIVMFSAMVGWWLLAVLLAALCARKGYQRLTAFGTARFAEASDLRGMIDAPQGIILGRMDDSRKPIEMIWDLFNPRIGSETACRQFVRALFGGKPPLVRLPKAIHTAVFAPTGVGKGVSFVIPHLLTCPDSTVVVDFKGDNARATASHRAKVFGHRIVLLDPFKQMTRHPDSFNPLDYIDADSPVAIDECLDLGNALVTRTGQEREPHWCDSAELWIAAMTAVIVQYGKPGDRSLQTVRDLLTNPQEMETAIKVMCGSTAWDGMLSRLGNQLTHFKDKELGSVLTTASRFMRHLDTLAVAESTKSSSFDPADLRKGKMTVFLILSPDHQRAMSPLLRMWIGSLLRAVLRGGLQEKHKVHFVIDEAASLGHMDALDDAVDKYRAYGVRLQLYYQSLGQLKKCWPEGGDQTLLSNTTQIYFGVADNETAKTVSDRLGEYTQIVESGGTSSGKSRQVSDHNSQNSSTSYSWNSSENWQQNARRLLKPEEVQALSDRTAITFTPGVPPIWTTLVRYYEKDFRMPGWFGRFWARLTTFAVAVIILVLAIIAAAGMSGVTDKASCGVNGTPQGQWQPFK